MKVGSTDRSEQRSVAREGKSGEEGRSEDTDRSEQRLVARSVVEKGEGKGGEGGRSEDTDRSEQRSVAQSVAQEGTKRKLRTRVFSASIPMWMSAEIEPDVLRMGVGSHHHGGTQGIVMAALSVYLAIPVAERVEVALQALPAIGEESMMRARLGRLWPVRLVRTLGMLERDVREHEIETLERAVREMGGEAGNRE